MGERAAARASRKAISVPPGELLSYLRIHPCHLRAGRGTSDRTGAAARLLQAGGTFPAAFAGRPPGTTGAHQARYRSATTERGYRGGYAAVTGTVSDCGTKQRRDRPGIGPIGPAVSHGRPANVPGVGDTLSRIPEPRQNRASHPAWI